MRWKPESIFCRNKATKITKNQELSLILLELIWNYIQIELTEINVIFKEEIVYE